MAKYVPEECNPVLSSRLATVIDATNELTEYLGMCTLCQNNFGNNRLLKELRITLE